MGYLHGFSQPSVSKALHLPDILSKHIYFPQTLSERIVIILPCILRR
ncbi:unnamed protein product [Acanthoscelides obtectus]|uniref:Uncharacterized protein n=1 Tax=Acanthoscelides obtectus TaxID=200917 RepID=A0A9P0LLX3_ACAOB|nr:unnamed protein product [Acanthoscelides obtectus]CAK1624400.1 hypothetical protein AOBTE_LOCUS2548 [Acanthoscelides obtectus]